MKKILIGAVIAVMIGIVLGLGWIALSGGMPTPQVPGVTPTPQVPGGTPTPEVPCLKVSNETREVIVQKPSQDIAEKLKITNVTIQYEREYRPEPILRIKFWLKNVSNQTIHEIRIRGIIRENERKISEWGATFGQENKPLILPYEEKVLTLELPAYGRSENSKVQVEITIDSVI
jgi:hypothetical protein